MFNSSLIFQIFILYFLTIQQLCLSKLNQTNLQNLQQLQQQINKLENENLILNMHRIQNYTQEKDGCLNGQLMMTKMEEAKYDKVVFSDLELSQQMQNYCQIHIPAASSHFLFQTPRGSYIGVNDANESTFKIYNPECQHVTTLQNILVQQTYCDRGLCDDGNVVLLTQNWNMIVCSQAKNFTYCHTITSLHNAIKGQIAGIVIRNKGTAQFEAYVADSAGEIIAYDGQGNRRLAIPMEKDSKITAFLDIHPHPLVVSQRGWIYTFDNMKYSITLTKCPYLFHQIAQVFVSHPYSSFVYLMSPSVVTKLDIKNQPKACEIISKFYIGHNIDQIIDIENKLGKIAEYQGNLYIKNKIIDTKGKSVQQLKQCGNSTAFNFQLMKNNYRKGYFTLQCCIQSQNENKCGVIVFRNKTSEQNSSKNNTIIMIVILILIVLLIFFFLRSTTPNLDYDEELKYDNGRYRSQIQEYLRNKPKQKDPNPSRQAANQQSPSKKIDKDQPNIKQD